MRAEKVAAIAALMQTLGIREQDLLEKFILGSGRGGQKLNKTHNCVYLKHLPSGIEIRCQATRSRETNRWLARRGMCEEMQHRLQGKAPRRLRIIRLTRK